MNNINPRKLISIIIPVLYLKRPKNPRYFYKPVYSIHNVLKDISSNVRIDHEVIVISNGTDPELEKYIRDNTIVDKFCLNSTNVGVSRSWNIGAQLAEGKTLCFVNDDVYIGENAIETLYKQLYRSDDVGIVGPKGAIWHGAEHVRYVGQKQIETADAISGFLFMLKRELFNKVGGFDVTYTPAGFEEIDMCYMVRRLGMKCLVVPKINIKHYHQHGVSARNVTINYMNRKETANAIHMKNLKYFKRKWNIVND